METPLYVLLSQQDAMERQMAVVSQNVANTNTTGYKGSSLLFEDFLEPTGKTQSHFVLDSGTLRDTSQGPLLQTGSPLDFAISGHGYFEVQTPQGVQYTRQGSFQLDAEGNLVTVDGYKVLDANGSPLSIPADAKQLTVGADGVLSTDVGNVGRLQPVHFDNEQALQETYGGFYTSDTAPTPDAESTVSQGMIEGSNVKPVVEMTRIIEISRAYQRTLNLIASEDSRIHNVIRDLGKPI